MNYIFVLQNKTFDTELRGGYLYVAKYGYNDNRVFYWSKMAKVKMQHYFS